MSAYPSILVLGHDGENIHRFHGFKEPAPLVAELRDALARWALYRSGDAWDHPPARPAVVTDAGASTFLPAPSDEVPCGIVELGGALWIGQGRTLFALDPSDGAVLRRIALDHVPQDIASDGEHLFVIAADWPATSPIRVLDPSSGAVVREIATKPLAGQRAPAPRGLCFSRGRLWVSEIQGTVHCIDPSDGAVLASHRTGLSWVFGLAFDGEHFVTGGRDALHVLAAETLQPVAALPMNYRLRAVGFARGEYLLMEQPEPGFDRDHRPIRVFPRPTLVHRLRLPPTDLETHAGRVVVRIHREGSGESAHVRWQIGTQRYESLDRLEAMLGWLRRRHRDGAAGVHVAPGDGVTYADVARTVEAATRAGSTDITFEGEPRAR